MAAGSNSIAFFLGLAFLTVFSGCPWQRLCIGVSSHTQLLSPPSVSTAIAMPAPSAADGSLEGASGAPANLLAGCAAYFKASYHHLASAKKHGTPLAEIISTMFKSSEIFGLPVGRKIDTKKRAPPMLVAHRTLLKNCFLQSMEHRCAFQTNGHNSIECPRHPKSAYFFADTVISDSSDKKAIKEWGSIPMNRGGGGFRFGPDIYIYPMYMISLATYTYMWIDVVRLTCPCTHTHSLPHTH